MKKLCLLFLLILACQAQQNNSTASTPETLPNATEMVTGDEEPEKMRGMVAAHNKWRKELGLPPLEWSNELAGVAQTWANKLKRRGCNMKHSSSQYGENLYWSSGMTPSPEDVVASWASERKYFNHKKKKCNGPWYKCGHYTQLIWKNTKKVGCAVAYCGDQQIWVCNYDPAGNYSGEKPY